MTREKSEASEASEAVEGIRIIIEIEGRHEYSVRVQGEKFPPLAAVEEALNLAVRRFLEYQHAAQRAKVGKGD